MFIARALERNRKLKNLSLRDNKLDSIALCSVAEALVICWFSPLLANAYYDLTPSPKRSNRGLQVLDLSGNMMSGENDMNGVSFRPFTTASKSHGPTDQAFRRS